MLHILIAIYIPLCLYFNARGGNTVPDAIVFTFHYVSILMHKEGEIDSATKKYLHSIMSLF